MNLIEDFKEVTIRIKIVKETINKYSDESNIDEGEKRLMKMFGSSISKQVDELKRELEGLLITEAWLKDTLGYYIEKEGFSMDLNYTHIVGEDK